MTPEDHFNTLKYLEKLKKVDDEKKTLFVSTSDWVFNKAIIEEAISRGCTIVGYSSKKSASPSDKEFLDTITDAGAKMHWSTDCDSAFPAETMADGLLKAITANMDVDENIKSLSLFHLKKWLDSQHENNLFTTHTFVSDDEYDDWD